MIKPEDINTTQNSSTDLHKKNLNECELQFDTAIRNAEQSGKWPAHVRNSRDGMTSEAIEETVNKYMDAGWVVLYPRTPGVRVSLSLPTSSK